MIPLRRGRAGPPHSCLRCEKQTKLHSSQWGGRIQGRCEQGGSRGRGRTGWGSRRRERIPEAVWTVWVQINEHRVGPVRWGESRVVAGARVQGGGDLNSRRKEPIHCLEKLSPSEANFYTPGKIIRAPWRGGGFSLVEQHRGETKRDSPRGLHVSPPCPNPSLKHKHQPSIKPSDEVG